MAERRIRAALLTAIAACAMLIVAFSFVHWVEFSYEGGPIVPGLPDTALFSLDGTEASRIQGAGSIDSAADAAVNGCTCRAGFGDGYMVAILGGIVLLAVVAVYVTPVDVRLLMTAAITASLAAFTIAGYNAIADWEGVGRAAQTEPLQLLEGEVRTELYLLTSFAGLAAILSAGLLATMSRRPEPEPDIEGADEELGSEMAPQEEVNETWA